MNGSASSLPSQVGPPRLPRRLNRNVSPLILDIRDYGSAFEREAALPPPPDTEGTDPKPGPVPAQPAAEQPAAASRAGRTGGLLVLLLFAALGALGTMVFLDAQRITLLERQVQILSQQLDTE